MGGSVGVTVSAGVLVSARRNRKKAERRGVGGQRWWRETDLKLFKP